MASRAEIRQAVSKQRRVQKSAKLGSGARFAALRSSIGARGGVRDPGAVAAAVGRKVHGAKTMARLSVAGMKRGGG